MGERWGGLGTSVRGTGRGQQGQGPVGLISILLLFLSPQCQAPVPSLLRLPPQPPAGERTPLFLWGTCRPTGATRTLTPSSPRQGPARCGCGCGCTLASGSLLCSSCALCCRQPSTLLVKGHPPLGELQALGPTPSPLALPSPPPNSPFAPLPPAPPASLQFGSVRSARVKGSQCYGFVEYASRHEAEALLDSLAQQPLVVEGYGKLRVNWSQGSMPDWKVSQCGGAGGASCYCKCGAGMILLEALQCWLCALLCWVHVRLCGGGLLRGGGWKFPTLLRRAGLLCCRAERAGRHPAAGTWGGSARHGELRAPQG